MICSRLSILVGFVAVLFSGCGGLFGGGAVKQDPNINASTALGPHGGQAIPLTDNKGFFEVLIEPAGQNGQRCLAVFFLSTDMKSPLGELPTSVGVQLSSVDGEETVSLSPQPKASDPMGEGRFVSPPGPYDADEYRGKLTATLGGKSFAKPFAMR